MRRLTLGGTVLPYIFLALSGVIPAAWTIFRRRDATLLATFFPAAEPSSRAGLALALAALTDAWIEGWAEDRPLVTV